MTLPVLPSNRQALVEPGGIASRTWHAWFEAVNRALVAGDTPASAVAQAVAQIARALGSPDGSVENIPESAGVGTVRGDGSIQSVGLLSNGLVLLSLAGDVDAPGPTYCYGTDAAGEKGWHPISNALAATANITLTVGADGITTFDLADVTPTDGGTLQKTAFDAKGRRTQEAAATTSDLREGANLYFTDERAIAAAAGTYFAISQRFAELPDEAAVIEARTNLGLQNIDAGTFN